MHVNTYKIILFESHWRLSEFYEDTPNRSKLTVMKNQRLLAIVIIVYGHNMGQSAQEQTLSGKMKP